MSALAMIVVGVVLVIISLLIPGNAFDFGGGSEELDLIDLLVMVFGILLIIIGGFSYLRARRV